MERWLKWGIFCTVIGFILFMLASLYSRSCAGMFCGLGFIIVSPAYWVIQIFHLSYLLNSPVLLSLFFILNIVLYFIPGALIGWIVTQLKSEKTKIQKIIMILSPIVMGVILSVIIFTIISSVHNSGANDYMKKYNERCYSYWSCLVQCPTQENSGYTQNHFFNQTIFEQTCESNCNNLYPGIPNVSPGMIANESDFRNYYDSNKSAYNSKEFQTCFALGGRAEAEKFKACLINTLPIIKEKYDIK